MKSLKGLALAACLITLSATAALAQNRMHEAVKTSVGVLTEDAAACTSLDPLPAADALYQEISRTSYFRAAPRGCAHLEEGTKVIAIAPMQRIDGVAYVKVRTPSTTVWIARKRVDIQGAVTTQP